MSGRTRIILRFVISVILFVLGFLYYMPLEGPQLPVTEHMLREQLGAAMFMGGFPYGWYILNRFRSNREYIEIRDFTSPIGDFARFMIKVLFAFLFGWLVAPFVILWMIFRLFKPKKEYEELDV